MKTLKNILFVNVVLQILLLVILFKFDYVFLLNSNLNSLKLWYPKFYFIALFVLQSKYILGLFPFVFPRLKLSAKLVVFIMLLILIYNTNHFFSTIFLSASILGYYLWQTLRMNFSNKHLYYIKCLLFDLKNFDLNGLILNLIIVLSIIYRVLLGLTSSVLGGDASPRYYISYIWSSFHLKNGNLEKIIFPDIDWLPLHFWFSGLIMSISDNDYLLILAHSLVALIGTYFFYKLAFLISKSKLIAKICLFAILIYPAHISISSTFMSDPLFSFTFFGAAYYLFLYLKTKLTKHLAICSLFVCLASLLRFEGWVLAFIVLTILLLFSNIIFQAKKLVLTLSPFLIMLLIMSYTYYKGYGAFRWLNTSDDQVQYFFKTFGYSYKNIILYIHAWIPFTIVTFLISILFIKRRAYKIYYLFVCLYCLPFIYKFFDFTIAPDYRYVVIYFSLFLIPFVILLYELVSRHSRKYATSLTSFILILLMIPSYSVPPEKSAPEQLIQNMNIFISEIPEGSFIIDYYPIIYHYYIVAKLDLPINLQYDDPFLNEHFDFEEINKAHISKETSFFPTFTPEINYGEKVEEGKILKALQSSTNTNYILLFKNGLLNDIFCFEKEIETYKDYKFEKVYEYDSCMLYKEI